MINGETRKYIVPMTGLRLGKPRTSVTEEEKARGEWVLQTEPANPKLIEVTFTPAPEFIRAPLTAEEQTELDRLCEATRGDV